MCKKCSFILHLKAPPKKLCCHNFLGGASILKKIGESIMNQKFKTAILFGLFFSTFFAFAQKKLDFEKISNSHAEKVPMRDGIRLYTRVYFPKNMKLPVSTILLRTPYSKAFGKFLSKTWVRFTQGNGYAFVIQSVRGTGNSSGKIDPLAQEFNDGRDTVKWIFRQKWSNKKIATVGSSYDGFTALAAAHIPKGEKREEGYVSVVIADGYPVYSFSSWPMSMGGVPKWDSLWWWPIVLRAVCSKTNMKKNSNFIDVERKAKNVL